MNKLLQQDKNNPREIPTKTDPNQTQPDKAPGEIPDATPGDDNPINPQEDQ